MSDIHYGKRTVSYSTAEFSNRMNMLSEKMYRIKELLNAYVFDRLVVVALGDLIDGTCIYPTQAHHQDLTSVADQATELCRLLHAFLSDQSEIWGRVQVECVPGNHGRSGMMAAERDNWDMMMYKLLKISCSATNNIDIIVADDDIDPFLRVIDIHGHGFLLYHGDGIYMYQSIPWYGLQQRLPTAIVNNNNIENFTTSHKKSAQYIAYTHV